MRYYLIAGEASGDLHASNLMRALRQEDPQAEFRCIGGDRMRKAGGTLLRHYRELAYMGFVSVALHLRGILRLLRECRRDIAAWKPDVLILVDYSGFNLRVAKHVHTRTRIPVHYYIAPKVWAWQEGRIESLRRYVDELYVILPFEADYFRRKGLRAVHYVGNPCVDAVRPAPLTLPREEAGGNRGGEPLLALLPGSRRQEIRDNLSIMLEAATETGGCRIVVAGAPDIPDSYYRQLTPAGTAPYDIVQGQTYGLLSAATAALVTSGTATLETALLGTPQVVCYHTRMGRLVAWLRHRLLKVQFISLVNLIAGREVVSELVGNDMNKERVGEELRDILPGGNRRQRMLEGYEEVRRKLGPPGASERTARLIVHSLSAVRS